MAMNQELADAVQEVSHKMPETEGFRLRFRKLIENYMAGMGSEAEIADIIDMIQLTGDADEN